MIDKSDTKKVSIRKIIGDLKVGVAYIPDGVDYYISTTDINRPGMQLNGYYDHFPDDRIQVMGKVEYSYYLSLDEETKKERMDKYMSYDLPVVIVARAQMPDEIMINAARKYNRIILTTPMGTTKFIYKLLDYLKGKDLGRYTTLISQLGLRR